MCNSFIDFYLFGVVVGVGLGVSIVMFLFSESVVV